MSGWKVVCTAIIIVLAILGIFYAAFFVRWDAKGLHWGLHETPGRYVRCRPPRYQRTPSGGYVTINTCYRRASVELQERRKREEHERRRKDKEQKNKGKELKALERELEAREGKEHQTFSFWNCIKKAVRKLRWQKRRREVEKKARKQRRLRAAAHMDPVTPIIIKPSSRAKDARDTRHGSHSHLVEQIVPPFTTHPPRETPVTPILVKKAPVHKKHSPHPSAREGKGKVHKKHLTMEHNQQHPHHGKSHGKLDGQPHGRHQRHSLSLASEDDEFERLLGERTAYRTHARQREQGSRGCKK